MTPQPMSPPLPDHWTPDQALAVFEMIDLLRDQMWRTYGQDIQRALREDRLPKTRVRTNTDPPF